MNIKLLTEQRLEFLSLKIGDTGSSGSTHVKMSHCWNSHVTGKQSNESVHEIPNNVACATSKASDQPAHMRRLVRAFASRLSIL